MVQTVKFSDFSAATSGVQYVGVESGANVIGTIFNPLPPNTVIPQPIIEGFTNGSSAASGVVGEEISSNVLFASAVPLTNGVARDITSISLTAGQWIVYGNVCIATSGATLSGYDMWTNTISAALPDESAYSQIATTAAVQAVTLNTPTLPLNLTVTTTVYLSAACFFTGGTAKACGQIFAIRVR